MPVGCDALITGAEGVSSTSISLAEAAPVVFVVDVGGDAGNVGGLLAAVVEDDAEAFFNVGERHAVECASVDYFGFGHACAGPCSGKFVVAFPCVDVGGGGGGDVDGDYGVGVDFAVDFLAGVGVGSPCHGHALAEGHVGSDGECGFMAGGEGYLAARAI